MVSKNHEDEETNAFFKNCCADGHVTGIRYTTFQSLRLVKSLLLKDINTFIRQFSFATTRIN